MVLLTSSAVSVALSGGVVCMFTFLLFLSGYTLQQQTVRSLQEAIRRPPEPKPVPTLPPQFHDVNETVAIDGESVQNEQRTGLTVAQAIDKLERLGDSVQVPVVVQDDGQHYLQGSSEAPTSSGTHSIAGSASPLQRLAYMFTLSEPSDLCSTLLFVKQQRGSSRLPSEPSIILLYPVTWERETSDLYTSTLKFMRELQELHGLVYHPVQINGAGNMNAQLLGELQWHRWEYDQALYLRSPGIVLKRKALDDALASPASRKSWAPVDSSTGDNPELLLWTPNGLQSPRREMRRLVAVADADWDEARYGDAAYVLIDRDNLDGAGHGETVSQALVHQFEEGRRSVCAGSGILGSSA
ncbi:hypothetical protein LTS07_001789 [Exophiala sideris]|uniref:Uncharacterized protein n=1 Tax=Exophiala sideris TaxID=1016849 RepID=A0ABR0JP95_9EURO|nr:hypothetical protein LTS07_001789 [Exophiala sideris]KAK5044303.1 hypothetical protein LTR13_000659 [Exophiala sideris]KAK5067803.1 hypothetical protein LTR69_001792 [Exophiala sideris]KAK5183957.1 hypothetical protein LTR44_003462 [Eurotiomycetes sp. CCFEE 6388]